MGSLGLVYHREREDKIKHYNQSENCNGVNTVLLQGYIGFLASCDNLVYRDLDCLFLSLDITLAHHTDDSMWLGPSVKELATTVDLLIRYLHVMKQEIILTKIRGTSASVKFLGVQWCAACQNISSKVKNKLSHLATSIIKEEAECLAVFWGGEGWRRHILSVWLQPVYWPKKLLVLNWVQNKRNLQQVQDAVQASLPFGPSDTAWTLWQTPICE